MQKQAAERQKRNGAPYNQAAAMHEAAATAYVQAAVVRK